MNHFDLTLAAVVALLVVCALFLLRLPRFSQSDPAPGIGVPRMLGAVGALAIAISLLPRTFVAPAVSDAEEAELHWHLDYEDAWKEAIKSDKPIFIFVTAVTDTNARYCEKAVFDLPGVQTELKRYVRVKLYTDWVPDTRLSREESQRRGERNQRWCQAILSDYTEPACVVIKPAADGPFENGVPKGSVLAKHLGIIRDVPEFIGLLRNANHKAPRG
jgi:hypothetical protein